MQAPPPAGVIRPNAKALSLGLSFAQAFPNGPSSPFLARGGLAATTKVITSGGINMLGGVPAMAGNGAYWGANSALNTYSCPQNAGTIMVTVTADHDANDGVGHQIFYFGQNSTNFGIEAVKWADNNIYIGIRDKIMSVAAGSTYVSGDTFTVALTWNAAGQIAYLGGARLVASAGTGLGDTSGVWFLLGQYFNISRKWSSSADGGILCGLVFDQALTPAQIAEAETDFWWWARQPARSREAAGPVPPDPPITATGSIITTPPDFGYPQSITRGPPNPALSV